MIKNFTQFLAEQVVTTMEWKDMTFSSHAEMEVADVAEESLQSKYLLVFTEQSPEFKVLDQIKNEGEKVLEITNQDLILFTEPFEFLMWHTEDPDTFRFIIKAEDYNKI